MEKTLTVSSLLLSFFFSNAQTDSITGPRVWLNADRSQLTEAKWIDLSFYKNDAAGATPAATPSTYSVINFNKALVFDGIDDYLKIPYNLEGLAEVSVLTVFQSADTTERGIWGTEDAVSRNILLTTRRAIGPDTIADLYGQSEKVVIQNAVLQNWDNTTITSSNATMALGSSGISKIYKPFRGSIAEIIVFNRALSFLERVQYETYLAIKYGTGLNSGNFVSSKEKVLWHVTENRNFGKNIAGIGRDNHFHLNQKQSGSAYDSGLLVMSAGTLAVSNDENTTPINDQDFILWGDNALPLTTQAGTGEDSILSFVQRRWLVDVSGNTVSGLSTELHVDITKFPSDPLGYWLIIDRSGQENFSIRNVEYVFPDEVADGKLVFKNIHWDTDGSGKDHFGFARARNILALVRKLSDASCTDAKAGTFEVEVIAGKAPYNFSLTRSDGTLEREWKETNALVVQKDLGKGQYTLTMKDAQGESFKRSFEVTTPDALNIDVGADRQLSQANPVVLTVGDQIPDSIEVSYLWENSHGFSSSDPEITVNETGIYRLTVIKQTDGCAFTDQVTIGGAEFQRVSVYPTFFTTTDNYHVSVSLEETGPVAVKIFNTKGIMMTSFGGSESPEYQFVTKMPETGVFLVVIQTAKGFETRKILVH